MTLTWPTGHFCFLHPEGPENRREATPDSPGRPGRRVRNCQTRFSPLSIQCRVAKQPQDKCLCFAWSSRYKGAGAEADGGACAPDRSE
jgi:hypothetical protein